MTAADLALGARLAARGRRRSYERGSALCVEGDVSDRVFVLESGLVKACCSSVHGQEIVLGICGPGDVIGELATLDGAPRSASTIALTGVQAVVVPAVEVHAALSDPAVVRQMLEVVVARLRDADRKRIEFASLDTVGRVAMRTLELADRFGRRTDAGVMVDLPISQEELASWCGASREATVKALRTLRELGYVRTGRGSLLVLDPEALRRRAAV
ncbi:Crp/Fnr family transcriptional regulator [Capillimicrobium parvum]|uniref:CRP-like cAMP-activated global transcriptional regulator n=1 Tax=Capillimicrobium parvum TaxID=2884022 RepID=A0A9E7C0T1_9ACTN|nr:Crp/Fnr family transcriptional regulator [Capillimicrobium parvum]UGS36706.1 CRP-like cAMP-activated global transcriptional regulator [Capillimicrobium parvum]